MSIGVPVKLLHESIDNVVTIELKTGELYRGYLIEAEDNMNCRLDSCQLTSSDGKTAYLEQVYLRGSQIRFVIVPDMFKNAPMFKRVKNNAKGRNLAELRTKAKKIRGKSIKILSLKLRRGGFQRTAIWLIFLSPISSLINTLALCQKN